MDWKRIIYISFFSVFLVVTAGIACRVYWGFNGNPWTKSQVAHEILEYASKKYDREMMLETTTFDMKENTYGARIRAKDDPSFRIGIVKRRVSPTNFDFVEYRQ